PVPVALSLNMAETADKLLAIKPAFVFNLVEAIEGRGNLIACAPLLLDSLQLPYTGAQAEAMFLSSGKIIAKRIMARAGIATPDFLTVDGPGPAALQPTRYIIKSEWEHASLGLDESAVFYPADSEHLRNKILSLEKRLGSSCFAEAFIDGRELNIALLAREAGPEVLPPAEMIFADYPPDKVRMLCYRAKWTPDSFEYEHTRRSFDFSPQDQPLLRQVSDIAMLCWEAFNLRGYARVDFRIDQAGQPWVLEVNANPCLSPDGGFVAAAARGSLDYDELIGRIVKDIPRKEGA
ncbi:MAG: D-alanine--D-alanine ligase, partial [Deltaproteobacteria bacterium]|nr:D-alanine--D-alanine ligase [Deltaproteobacteria bacterium]